MIIGDKKFQKAPAADCASQKANQPSFKPYGSFQVLQCWFHVKIPIHMLHWKIEGCLPELKQL